MKHRLIFFLLIGSLSQPALAAQYGLGVAMNDYEYYVPVIVNPVIRLELFAGYSRNMNNLAATRNYETWQSTLGIGLFRYTTFKPYALYYGARAGYVKIKSNLQQSNTVVVENVSGYEQSGYQIAPVLGLEYLVSEHFAIAGEVSFRYEHLTGTETYVDFANASANTSNINNQTNSEVNSQIVLR